MPILKIRFIHNAERMDFDSIFNVIKHRLVETNPDWTFEFHSYRINSGSLYPEVDVTYGLMVGRDNLSEAWKRQFHTERSWGLGVRADRAALIEGVIKLGIEFKDGKFKLNMDSDTTKATLVQIVASIEQVIQSKTGLAPASQFEAEVSRPAM